MTVRNEVSKYTLGYKKANDIGDLDNENFQNAKSFILSVLQKISDL